MFSGFVSELFPCSGVYIMTPETANKLPPYKVDNSK